MGLKIPRRAISVQVRLLPAAPVQIPHTETGRAGNPATKNPGLKPGFLNSSTRTLTSRHDARHGASRLHARGASHARHGCVMLGGFLVVVCSVLVMLCC